MRVYPPSSYLLLSSCAAFLKFFSIKEDTVATSELSPAYFTYSALKTDAALLKSASEDNWVDAICQKITFVLSSNPFLIANFTEEAEMASVKTMILAPLLFNCVCVSTRASCILLPSKGIIPGSRACAKVLMMLWSEVNGRTRCAVPL